MSSISITAAAELNGLAAGAQVDLTQVATAMHDKARALPDRAPRVPIARINLPFANDRVITERMSAEAALQVIEAASSPQALVAAGGWCTPSENMYDIYALDGMTGLLDMPTVQVSRGGINIPSYIGIDAADGALWSWSEAQEVPGSDPPRPRRSGRIWNNDRPCPRVRRVVRIHRARSLRVRGCMAASNPKSTACSRPPSPGRPPPRAPGCPSRRSATGSCRPGSRSATP